MLKESRGLSMWLRRRMGGKHRLQYEALPFLVADWVKQSCTLSRGDTKTYGLKGREVTTTDSSITCSAFLL